MTAPALPDPLVPADIDLRGLEYMPLLGHHLYGSEFDALASDGEYRAAMRLWWAAWNQQPAGSLPNNDLALCKLAGKGDDRAAVKRWLKLKPAVMRGFVLCADGRLYHRFLCKQVLIAWEKRLAERARAEADQRRKRQERDWRAAVFEQLRAIGVTPVWNIPSGALRKLADQHIGVTVTPSTGMPVTSSPDMPVTSTPDDHVTPPVRVTGGVTVTPNVTAKTGRDVLIHSDPIGSEADASLGCGQPDPPKAAVDGHNGPEALTRAETWRAAVSVLGQGGCPPDQCRTFVGRLVQDFGYAVVQHAVASAVTHQPAEAREYLRATCQRLQAERPASSHGDEDHQRTAEYLAAQQRHAEEARSPEATLARAEALARMRGAHPTGECA